MVRSYINIFLSASGGVIVSASWKGLVECLQASARLYFLYKILNKIYWGEHQSKVFLEGEEGKWSC